ncbi:MAG: hypothetical protein IKM79_04160 [Bacteroidales bacterium]|nr:hypothetical protein [Bacteroidales bacterium]
MKKILIAIMLLPMAAWAQVDSTSARIVDRYLDILNIDALPQDSMLVLTTTITSTGSNDTVVMQRWYQSLHMFRVEVKGSTGLQTALCGNGKNRYRGYLEGMGWGDMTSTAFYNHLIAFDFRGPLHGWRAKNLIMSYAGKVNVEQREEKLDAVRVEVEGSYTRLYLFEPSGLLGVIVELDEALDSSRVTRESHIEWKCEHEYGMIGETLLPTLESFMRDNRLTILRTEMHFEPRNDKLFNHD